MKRALREIKNGGEEGSTALLQRQALTASTQSNGTIEKHTLFCSLATHADELRRLARQARRLSPILSCPDRFYEDKETLADQLQAIASKLEAVR